jgi:hypothetical protein
MTSGESGGFLSLKSKLPTWSLGGRFGSTVESKLPFHEFSSEITGENSLSLTSKLPCLSGSLELLESSYFQLLGRLSPHLFNATLTDSSGYEFDLTSKFPCHKGRISLYEEGHWSLSSKLPSHKMSGTFNLDQFYLESNLTIHKFKGLLTEGEVWTLSSLLPVHEMEASFYGDWTLSGEIPVCKFHAYLKEEDTWILSSALPTWKLIGEIWYQEMILESKLPLSRISFVMTENDPTVPPYGDINDDSFIGVLRYVRP